MENKTQEIKPWQGGQHAPQSTDPESTTSMLRGSTCSVFSIVPMEGSGTNEKPPELKRVRGSISAVLSDINKSSNHRFGNCQGVNMLRFLQLGEYSDVNPATILIQTLPPIPGQTLPVIPTQTLPLFIRQTRMSA